MYRRDLEREEYRKDLPDNYMAQAEAKDEVWRCLLNVPNDSGVFTLRSTKPNAFSSEDIAFAKQISDILAIGISRLNDFEALEKEIDERKRAEETTEKTSVMHQKMVQQQAVALRISQAVQAIDQVSEFKDI